MLEQVIKLADIIGFILKVYSWVHIAAFIASWINADPNNSIVSVINRTTLPLWNWVAYKLPRNLTAFAPIFALMLVYFAEKAVPGIVRSLGAILTQNLELNEGLLNIVFYIVYGGLYIISNIVGFVFFLAIIWFIFTLVNPPLNNPIIRSIMYLIDPLITPLQRVLPRSKIDLSPLVLAGITFLIRELLFRIMAPVQAGLLI